MLRTRGRRPPGSVESLDSPHLTSFVVLWCWCCSRASSGCCWSILLGKVSQCEHTMTLCLSLLRITYPTALGLQTSRDNVMSKPVVIQKHATIRSIVISLRDWSSGPTPLKRQTLDEILKTGWRVSILWILTVHLVEQFCPSLEIFSKKKRKKERQKQMQQQTK